MKTLITINEVRKCIEHGEKSIFVDSNTIITPAAKDMAAEHSIKFTDEVVTKVCEEVVCEEKKVVCEDKKVVCEESICETVKKHDDILGNIDKDLIARIVKEVLMETMMKKTQEAFESECDPSGLKLIRGKTVVCERFTNGKENQEVGLKDVVNTKESPNMGAGFMTIENSTFDWELCYEEFEYIVEGNLDITINGNTYHGKAGDVFFIPKNSKVTWSTPDSARFFYVTYPANWEELAAKK